MLTPTGCSVPASLALLAMVALSLPACNFVVDNEPTPPGVSIESPENGAQFQADEAILFQADVTDRHDNNLVDSLVWRSDLTGRIGEGTRLTSVLEPGSHTVRATAFDDEASHTTSALVQFEVLNSP